MKENKNNGYPTNYKNHQKYTAKRIQREEPKGSRESGRYVGGEGCSGNDRRVEYNKNQGLLSLLLFR